MRPTRRAVVLVGICALAIWLASRFGARSLNAVVVPALVVLGAGVVQLVFTDRPTVHRRRPVPGFPGETRTVEIEVETDDPLPARITDRIDSELRTSFSGVTRSLPTSIDYEITLESRGEQRLGPLTLVVRDVLGLWTKTFEFPKRTPVLVYPETDDIPGTRIFGGSTRFSDDREQFDELREYVPGDSLRNVHWASSAKRDELVVMEFDAAIDVTGLAIAAGSTAGYADEMATAAASVATTLLDAGLAVSLSFPGGEIERDGGESQRERVLAALARTGHGRVDADADIRVFADADGTAITIADREMPFEKLTGFAAESAVNRVKT